METAPEAAEEQSGGHPQELHCVGKRVCEYLGGGGGGEVVEVVRWWWIVGWVGLLFCSLRCLLLFVVVVRLTKGMFQKETVLVAVLTTPVMGPAGVWTVSVAPAAAATSARRTNNNALLIIIKSKKQKEKRNAKTNSNSKLSATPLVMPLATLPPSSHGSHGPANKSYKWQTRV